MLWASEPWFFGAARRKIDLWDGIDDQGEQRSSLWQLPENELWSFSVNDRAPQAERTLTARPVRQVKAEGRPTVNFTKTVTGYRGNGGSVANPFVQQGGQKLDDPVTDIGTGLPQRKAITHCRVVSPNSHCGADKSEKTSSNVLDFRQGQTRGTNSSRSILSLLWNKSKACLPNNSGVPSNTSGSCMRPPNPDLSSMTSPLIDLRKMLGRST